MDDVRQFKVGDRVRSKTHVAASVGKVVEVKLAQAHYIVEYAHGGAIEFFEHELELVERAEPTPPTAVPSAEAVVILREAWQQRFAAVNETGSCEEERYLLVEDVDAASEYIAALEADNARLRHTLAQFIEPPY